MSERWFRDLGTGGSRRSGTVDPLRRNIQYLTKVRKQYTKVPLLIIDEWLLFKIDERDCKHLLKLIDRRHSKNSTMVISQFNPDEWIEQMPIQVAAEAITDRLTSKAYSIVIESNESMRKTAK